MTGPVYCCPWCQDGTELEDRGDGLWCPDCQETVPASAIREHPDYDGAPLEITEGGRWWR